MMAAEQQTAKYLADLLDRADMDGAVLEPQFASLVITGLTLDSRRVSAGDVFMACNGLQVDGRKFIESAVEAGAVAVLAERGGGWLRNNIFQGVPVIAVTDLVKKLSAIAAKFYDDPSARLSLMGVTGTNGKTSCTQLLMQLLNRLGQSCGVIGTLGTGIDGVFEAGINTTPDAIAIQRTVAQWVERGIERVAMEVSSHGLEQGRVAALHFDQAIFTNLTRDHLDYHGSMQAYGAAKTQLFQMPGLRTAILNGDDAFSVPLGAQIPGPVKQYVYSICRDKAAFPAVNVWVDNVHYHSAGISATIHSPWGEYSLNSPLLGAFNLSNILAVFIAAVDSGLAAEKVIEAVATLKTVPGRMQRVQTPSDVTVVVDYAHTPDALKHSLMAMRQHTTGKLWCVFGCGGERDPGKRPQMGEVAQRHADYVVVTSDNPRNEDPALIINEILGGIDCPALVEENRAAAIQFAVDRAAAGDSILVAGKGHEAYQQIGDDRIPYSDIAQVRLALAAREQRQGGGS